MLGPRVGLAIHLVNPTGFDVVFVASFSIAVLGVGMLLLFVENKPAAQPAPAAPHVVATAIRAVSHDRGLRALIVAAIVLSVATVSDGFLYLALQRQVGFRAGLVPLLYVGTATSYLAFAIPAGRLADRVGRRFAFVAGYGVLSVGYMAVLGRDFGMASIGLCVLSLGAYYALTDGVLMALASTLLPEHVLGTGLALLTTLTSIGRFAGSLAFGALWTAYGVNYSLVAFLVALAFGIGLATIVFTWTANDTGAAIS
jgi:MFS family permease